MSEWISFSWNDWGALLGPKHIHTVRYCFSACMILFGFILLLISFFFFLFSLHFFSTRCKSQMKTMLFVIIRWAGCQLFIFMSWLISPLSVRKQIYAKFNQNKVVEHAEWDVFRKHTTISNTSKCTIRAWTRIKYDRSVGRERARLFVSWIKYWKW